MGTESVGGIMAGIFYEQELMNGNSESSPYNIHDWQSIYDYFYKVSKETYGDSEEYAKAYAKGQAGLYYEGE